MNLFPTAELIPVSEWTYDLYRITYHATEDGPARVTDHVVAACENHLIDEIEDRWPGEWATYYQWERIKENVPAPRVIGQLYGHAMHESGIAAGRRMAEKLALHA